MKYHLLSFSLLVLLFMTGCQQSRTPTVAKPGEATGKVVEVPPEPTTAPPPPPAVAQPGRTVVKNNDRPLGSANTPLASKQPPFFPLPYPKPSSTQVLPQRYFRDLGTIRKVNEKLNDALDATGYDRRSYYRVPNGMAIATQIERIDENAKPFKDPDRWAIDQNPDREFSIMGYFRALFTATPGYYRTLVLLVTDQAVTADDEAPTRAQAAALVDEGAARPTAPMLNAPYTEDHYVLALVYEFEKPENRDTAIMLTPSRYSARHHLKAAELTDYLEH